MRGKSVHDCAFILLLYFSVKQVAETPRFLLPCTVSQRSSSSVALSQPKGKCKANITLTDGGGRPSSQISPVETSGEKSADASCCYLRMRDGVGWNDTLGHGLREHIGFSTGTLFLEGMIDAHLRSSVLSALARLWPCSCHTACVLRSKQG